MKKVSLFYWQLAQVMAQLPNPERWIANGKPPYVTVAAPPDEVISFDELQDEGSLTFMESTHIPFALSRNRVIPYWIPTVELEIKLEKEQSWY